MKDEGEDVGNGNNGEGEDGGTGNSAEGADVGKGNSVEGEDGGTGNSAEGEDGGTGSSAEGEDGGTGSSAEGADVGKGNSVEGEDRGTGNSAEGEDRGTGNSAEGEDGGTSAEGEDGGTGSSAEGEDGGTGNNDVYVPADTDFLIYRAALHDGWEYVRELFEERPELMTKPVNERLETPLMIAVGTNSSHEFVENLLTNDVGFYDRDAWCRVNKHRNNALHYAVKVGNMSDAKLIVQCFPAIEVEGRWSPPLMTRSMNIHGETPMILAAKLGRKDMLDVVFRDYEITGSHMIPAIQAGSFDFAKRAGYLNYLEYELTDDLHEDSFNAMMTNALDALAAKPEYFPSRLGLWGGLSNQWMPIVKSKIPRGLKRICQVTHIIINIIISVLLIPSVYVKTRLQQIHEFMQIQEIIREDLPIQELVKLLCGMMVKNAKDAKKFLEPAIATAVKYGSVELIEQCILACPGLIWYEFDGYNLFHLAIKERQVQVYNLVYQMSGHKAFVASELHEKTKENALHIAAKLAPPHRLSAITGAALQLQRELQWYKEVETFVEPEHVKALNKEGKTPWMVFTEEHKDLLKEGQQWMKETSTSCTVVAALIITITFAAAITVPGGLKDDGKPVFLNERAFMLFMVSNAFALFSSSTSLLMFLGILTSRYSEVDFLYTLPKRLMIGLVSLFLSIAATMIAFGATLALLLQDKVTWIAAPIVMITSIPVGLYALLQFTLLVEMVWSTYGPSIFGKQSIRKVY